MEKLKMHTEDCADLNIQKIGQLFPNCLTERLDENGKPEIAIDFDKLKQELSKDIIEGNQERYQFTWPGKREAMRLANTPSNMTLRPDRESSVDFDNTENLYIEGDNLEVLKLLRENYLGKVKMIYIDPPYNTGNDFVYEDDFSQSAGEFKDKSGMFDENGNMILDRFSVNSESNGRFHTDWLNMMYPRLKVARDLLAEDGVIFISIGQNELSNLEKICSVIFGECNKISVIGRLMKTGGGKGQFFSPNLEYILVYAKNVESATPFREPISDDIIQKLYTSTEESGERKGEKYRPFGLYQSSLDPLRGCTNQRYYIEAPDGTLLIPPGDSMPFQSEDGAMVVPQSSDDKVWRWTQKRYLEEKKKGNIVFKKSEGVLIQSNRLPAKWNVYSKIWLSDREEEGMVPVDLITKWENRHATKEVKSLNIPFDFAKPIGLIQYLMKIVGLKADDNVLDFFSGSATTAHAVMQLNAEDGGHRKFIMVQLPEKTDEKSEAFKAGYPTICEIGKERIRRAGKKIKDDIAARREGNLFEEGGKSIDTGFRVLKLDTSNMQDVYYKPEDSSDATLFEDNVKPDRTAEDLLFQVMLECNLPLSAKIEKKTISGKEVFDVNDGYLLACFDEDVNETVITEVAKQKPYYFIMRDKSLSSDNVADNFEQIFNAYSKDTIRKIL